MPGGDGEPGLQGAGDAGDGEALVGGAVDLVGVAAEPVADSLGLGEGGGAGRLSTGISLLAGVAEQVAGADPAVTGGLVDGGQQGAGRGSCGGSEIRRNCATHSRVLLQP
jgi:hypothetical protein